ncbi:hypothetical protein OH76DRAFT_1423914 [Lentinus brumalis]|uniref:HSA domain-containing protein n=1 Tax=Lentinus brumalis TaxID=2498619 RepID=A0A371CIK1_9APHY|nr:hypothetical protein OH76DRAFT_1423914 [Polyporus brumalis]
MHPPANTHGKLRALIELKSLRVIEKQRAMRASIAERLMHGSLLPLNRTDFRRTRKVQLRDIRATEAAERKQRADRERRAKQKHIEQLGVICSHGREIVALGRSAQDRISRLGKAVLSFHAHTEKEEQKRIERLAKERLKALKNDDEEAYMKLIDTAKDTRITHLLKQTDAYLDSLAQAVVEQQRADGHDPNMFGMVQEEGPVSEETFGAKAFSMEEEKGKLDYRIKAKVAPRGWVWANTSVYSRITDLGVSSGAGESTVGGRCFLVKDLTRTRATATQDNPAPVVRRIETARTDARTGLFWASECNPPRQDYRPYGVSGGAYLGAVCAVEWLVRVQYGGPTGTFLGMQRYYDGDAARGPCGGGGQEKGELQRPPRVGRALGRVSRLLLPRELARSARRDVSHTDASTQQCRTAGITWAALEEQHSIPATTTTTTALERNDANGVVSNGRVATAASTRLCCHGEKTREPLRISAKQAGKRKKNLHAWRPARDCDRRRTRVQIELLGMRRSVGVHSSAPGRHYPSPSLRAGPCRILSLRDANNRVSHGDGQRSEYATAGIMPSQAPNAVLPDLRRYQS